MSGGENEKFLTPSAKKASAYAHALRSGKFGVPSGEEWGPAWIKMMTLYEASFRERRQLMAEEIGLNNFVIPPKIRPFVRIAISAPAIRLDKEIFKVFLPFRRPGESKKEWRARAERGMRRAPAPPIEAQPVRRGRPPRTATSKDAEG